MPCCFASRHVGFTSSMFQNLHHADCRSVIVDMACAAELFSQHHHLYEGQVVTKLFKRDLGLLMHAAQFSSVWQRGSLMLCHLLLHKTLFVS